MLVGVDIVEIKRIKDVVERTPRFLYRVFTEQELAYCFQKANPYPSLAVRFASKEAVRKLHPAFSAGIRFHEIEVISNIDGRPELVLHGLALEKWKQNGIGQIKISLAHAKEQAIATAVALKG